MATQTLVDDGARRVVLEAHGRTLLVEAGAGSGKTAVLAGRIAMMLASGIAPGYIAAVTFTELAASELLFRIREFVSRMLRGDVPSELRLVLPDGLSAMQIGALTLADASIDDITCATIHGFCQRLISPYPVEANVDPGASVMDPEQQKLAFLDIVQDWLREELDSRSGELLTELVLADPDGAVEMVNTIVGHLRVNDGLLPPPQADLTQLVTTFVATADAYADFLSTSLVKEPETADCSVAMNDMATAVGQLRVQTASGLVALVCSKAHASLCKVDGDFKQFRKKGKWEEAAKQAGRSKAEGGTLNMQATACHDDCCRAWTELLQAAASKALHDLLPVLRPAVQRMQDYKRAAALLDFDDLLHSARDLLRNHESVRRALAEKYPHVLVDEFQDTDPLQTEIFWRLCGDPPPAKPDADWREFCIRPAALFLVGDPKQAIYRFRGADVGAYVWAREALAQQDRTSIVSISVNFRSCGPLLDYVNARFSGPLGAPGQPGFTALNIFHPARQGGPCVCALDIQVPPATNRQERAGERKAEAEAVARLCAHLIGNEYIVDPVTGGSRLVRPGDIALLAPTGTELWRYEQALEDRGIAVATQAGKGLFRRQEIQDLVAITRVLADSQDTLALGALLRGPLVGISDNDLLGVVWSLREGEDAQPPGLNLWLDTKRLQHPLAKEVLIKLQSLRMSARSTTPHNLISQAVDILRVRSLLMQRYGRQAERALANVDLFLHLSRAYDIRGLEAFAEAMTVAWEDENRAVEGRPDAQEEAVCLYTMHAAKGLEWPVVIPINAMTGVMAPNTDIVVRATNTLYCPVLGVNPIGHDAAMQAEKAEHERERVRLWYVATTRARELMIAPRPDSGGSASSWTALVDLDLPNLPAYQLPTSVPALSALPPEAANQQTAEVFATEAAKITALKQQVVWLAPSRDEDVSTPLVEREAPSLVVASMDGAVHDSGIAAAVVQGGRERGLILHKLLEEVLTGETMEAADALAARATELATMLGCPLSGNPAQGLSPVEVASCVLRALMLDAVASLRPHLVPEFSVFSADQLDGTEQVRAGVIDAIALADDGIPTAVIDWKSDVQPSATTLEHYKSQVRAYLQMSGTARGLIVFATTGEVHEVTPVDVA